MTSGISWANYNLQPGQKVCIDHFIWAIFVDQASSFVITTDPEDEDQISVADGNSINLDNNAGELNQQDDARTIFESCSYFRADTLCRRYGIHSGSSHLNRDCDIFHIHADNFSHKCSFRRREIFDRMSELEINAISFHHIQNNTFNNISKGNWNDG